MTSTLLEFRSPWPWLFVGFLLGHSSSSGTFEDVLESLQSCLVNTILVPIYGVCVVLRIAVLLSRRLDLFKKVVVSQEAQDSLLESLGDEADEEGPVNMTGAYKLQSNDNFDGFLEVQGVPWALRKAADKARPIHRILHRGKMIRIQIRGIIESETTYQIDGPPVEINIRGRIFRDTITYLESGDGIRVSKVATQENYNIEVTRRLSEDRKTITMTSRAIFKDGKEPVQSVQIFERIQ